MARCRRRSSGCLRARGRRARGRNRPTRGAPRARQRGRCPLPDRPPGKSLAPPRAAARRLDRDDVAGGEIASHLRTGRIAVDEVAAGCAGRASALAPRCLRATLANDRETAVLEHAELPDDTVAAATLALAAGAEPEAVALDAQRVLQLERLDRRRERV